MKKLLCVAVAVLASACASTRDDSGPDMPSATMPAVSTPDPRIGELQTQLTELLERIDVLNSRIAQLENVGPAFSAAGSSVASSEPAPAAAPQPARPAVSAGLKPAATSAAAPAESVQPQRALIGAQIAESYRQAIILFGRGRHAEARRAFEGVYESDSSGDLADNALFWIGETYFAAKDYTNAVRYYMRVVNDYSSQNKAPDALLKTAIVQARTGDLALARRTLQQVIERYPYSSSASSAKAELERIKY
jgi:tol-pal system protein YbgF